MARPLGPEWRLGCSSPNGSEVRSSVPTRRCRLRRSAITSARSLTGLTESGNVIRRVPSVAQRRNVRPAVEPDSEKKAASVVGSR